MLFRSSGESWRPDPSEPRLMLEREVLKVRLQFPIFAHQWSTIEPNAFTHPAYKKLREFIDTQPEFKPVDLSKVESDELRSFITELLVEPVKASSDITEKYATSVTSRLNEVAVTRSIAEIKSTLQRLNPVENESEYGKIFEELVQLEVKKRALHEASLDNWN